MATVLDMGSYAPMAASAQLPTNQVTLGNSTSQKHTPVGEGVST